MRKIIHKWFWPWDFDKEEAWLNEMVSKGLCMISYGWCRYEFEKCEPGEYSIRLQMLENSHNHPESEQYLEFIESTGAEHIGSWWKWIYLRKKRSDGEFEIFSDFESKIKHLTLIMGLLLFIGLFNIFIGFMNLFMMINLESPGNSIGFLNVILGVICIFGYIRLYRKRKKLKNDSVLFE